MDTKKPKVKKEPKKKESNKVNDAISFLLEHVEELETRLQKVESRMGL